MVIFIKYFASKCEYCDSGVSTVGALLEYVSRTKGYPKEILSVIYNGRYVDCHQTLENNSTVHIVLSLCGGKGGFGSMLRAIGAQIEKTTNREACRDLSGRRLRDINEEQRLKRWISKKAEREREAAERRRRKLEQLCSLPKHDFHDPEYDRQRRDLPEMIDDSLTHGLKVATHNKRKSECDLPSPKKKGCLWIDVNVDESEQSTENAAGSGTCTVSASTNAGCISPTSDESSVSSSSDAGSISTSCNTIEENSNNTDSVAVEPQSASNDCSSDKIPDSKPSSVQQDVTTSISNEGNKENDIALEVSSSDFVQSQKEETSLDVEPLDLLSFQSSKELEQLGLDRLKLALQQLGMKCGGTLQQRAERLWLVRGVDPSDISPKLLAKPSGAKK